MYSQKDDPRAVEYAKRSFEILGNRPEILDTYGWVLVKNGQIEKGVQLLQEALVGLPDHPEISYHTAYAFVKAGRNQEARPVIANLLNKHPSSPFAAKARELLKQIK